MAEREPTIVACFNGKDVIVPMGSVNLAICRYRGDKQGNIDHLPQELHRLGGEHRVCYAGLSEEHPSPVVCYRGNSQCYPFFDEDYVTPEQKEKQMIAARKAEYQAAKAYLVKKGLLETGKKELPQEIEVHFEDGEHMVPIKDIISFRCTWHRAINKYGNIPYKLLEMAFRHGLCGMGMLGLNGPEEPNRICNVGTAKCQPAFLSKYPDQG